MFTEKIKNQYLEVRLLNAEVGLPQRGFSMIELIVVIAIIGLMSAVMFANYRQGERNAALEYAAQQMAQDIRHAQNLSLAGPTSTYGYGIRFDLTESNNSYFIYGDIGIQNKDTYVPQYQYHKGEDEKVPLDSNIDLPSNIIIDSITVDPIGDIADIFFAPPDPITYINGSSAINTTAKIKICFTTDNTKCKTILVTTAGKVEVE